MFKWILAGALLLSVAEIYVLIAVGSVIGAGWTILLLIATTVIGMLLVRLQGLAVFHRAQAALARGDVPAKEMLEGLAMLPSGFLLLLPGFITDLIGVVLFVPLIRRALLLTLIGNRHVLFRQQQWSAHRHYSASGDIIEGEIVEQDHQQIR